MMQKNICYCCADLSLFHMEHDKLTNRNLLTNAFLDFYIKYLIISETVPMTYLRIALLYLGTMSHITSKINSTSKICKQKFKTFSCHG